MQCGTCIIDRPHARQARRLCARACVCVCMFETKGVERMAPLPGEGSPFIKNVFACSPRIPLTLAVKQGRVEVASNSSGYRVNKECSSAQYAAFEGQVRQCPSHPALGPPPPDAAWCLLVFASLPRVSLPASPIFLPLNARGSSWKTPPLTVVA